MEDNEFYIKYQTIDWKSDGIELFNKIGNNLTSRFGTIGFKVNMEEESPRLDIVQGDNQCSFYWDFDEGAFSAHLKNETGNAMRNIYDIESEITNCGILKESKNNKSIKRFESFVDSLNDEQSSVSKSEEKCKCGRFSKEDCKCGPNCDCDDCKDKYKDSK